MEIFYCVLLLASFFIGGYIFGSIPFGVIIGHFYHKDPRKYGSKNPGGTNVGRTISHTAGVLTILFDALKVLIPYLLVFLLVNLNEDVNDILSLNGDDSWYWYGQGNSLVQLSYYLVAFGGFIGHSYSIFLKFKGGKIVSTYVALMIGTSYLGILFCVLFLIILKIKKYVSLSSISMSIAFMLFARIIYIIYIATGCNNEIAGYMMWFDFGPSISIYFPIIASLGTALLIYKHKENIKRLKAGTESKVTWVDNLFKKKNKEN